MVSLDNALKLTSLAAALLYVLLFLGYRSYYSHLGLNPEDMGVSNSFILVRAVGFVGALACIGGAVWLMHFVSLQFTPGWSVRDLMLWFAQLALWVVLFVYARAMLPATWPRPAQIVLALAPGVLGILPAMLTHAGKVRVGAIAAISSTALLTIVIPCVALVTRGQDMARLALAGQPVEPFTLLGVPLLDVSAEPVRIFWIGAAEQRPTLLAPDSAGVTGLVLGEGSGKIAVLISAAGHNTVVTLPSSTVALQRQ